MARFIRVGRSSAIVIPKRIMMQLDISQDTHLSLEIEGGIIRLIPEQKSRTLARRLVRKRRKVLQALADYDAQN